MVDERWGLAHVCVSACVWRAAGKWREAAPASLAASRSLLHAPHLAIISSPPSPPHPHPPCPQNTAALFGGAVIAQYAMYNATNTRHNDNTAAMGGGGVKLMSAVVLLKNCELRRNRAAYGGGIDAFVIRESELKDVVVPTIVSVNVG